MPQSSNSSPSAAGHPHARNSREEALRRRAARPRPGKATKPAQQLGEELNVLLDKYRKNVPLREILMDTMEQVDRIAKSDRKSERDAVLKAVFEQGCRTVTEVREETGLGYWAAFGILQEFMMEDLVEMREKYYNTIDGEHKGEKAIEYHPRHTPAGSVFSSVRTSSNYSSTESD